MQQQQMQAQMQLQQAQTAVLMAQAKEAEGRAAKYATEVDLMPKEVAMKYSDTDKDGKIDVDFEKKIQLAQMLMSEDRWQVEKQEKQQAMQGQQAEQQRKAQEQEALQQMIRQNDDMLNQVTVEEGPLQ
jgi:hypothetical protein